jgi:hypothetical protein
MDALGRSVSAPTSGSASIRSTSLLLASQCRADTWYHEPTGWSSNSARRRRAHVDPLSQFKFHIRAVLRHPS